MPSKTAPSSFQNTAVRGLRNPDQNHLNQRRDDQILAEVPFRNEDLGDVGSSQEGSQAVHRMDHEAHRIHADAALGAQASAAALGKPSSATVYAEQWKPQAFFFFIQSGARAHVAVLHIPVLETKYRAFKSR